MHINSHLHPSGLLNIHVQSISFTHTHQDLQVLDTAAYPGFHFGFDMTTFDMHAPS